MGQVRAYKHYFKVCIQRLSKSFAPWKHDERDPQIWFWNLLALKGGITLMTEKLTFRPMRACNHSLFAIPMQVVVHFKDSICAAESTFSCNLGNAFKQCGYRWATHGALSDQSWWPASWEPRARWGRLDSQRSSIHGTLHLQIRKSLKENYLKSPNYTSGRIAKTAKMNA